MTEQGFKSGFRATLLREEEAAQMAARRRLLERMSNLAGITTALAGTLFATVATLKTGKTIFGLPELIFYATVALVAGIVLGFFTTLLRHRRRRHDAKLEPARSRARNVYRDRLRRMGILPEIPHIALSEGVEPLEHSSE